MSAEIVINDLPGPVRATAAQVQGTARRSRPSYTTVRTLPDHSPGRGHQCHPRRRLALWPYELPVAREGFMGAPCSQSIDLLRQLGQADDRQGCWTTEEVPAE